MKPLPPAPLTDDDWAIVSNHRDDAWRAYVMGLRLGHSRNTDRRDAALMLWAQGFTLGTEFAGRRGAPVSTHNPGACDTGRVGGLGGNDMKLLLKVPLTPEDWDVLNFAAIYHVRRHGFKFVNRLDALAIDLDRRDAALMWQAVYWRSGCLGHGPGQLTGIDIYDRWRMLPGDTA